MSEANKATSRRVIEDNARGVVHDELFAPDFVLQPVGSRGVQGLREFLARFHAAFPDLAATVEEQIAESDRVASRAIWRGTHQGKLGQIAPTGKAVTVGGVILHRYSNGKIAETYMVVDQLGMLRQIGAVPS